MTQLASIPGLICFTNPEQLPYIRQNGLYGNVSSGDKPSTPRAAFAARRTRFGKIKDMVAATPGAKVFLFERNASILHGIWSFQDGPLFSTTHAFDPADTYPYRLRLQRDMELPEGIPLLELHKLLDSGQLWSIRSFERDTQGPFSSVTPITSEETDILLKLLYRYNHRYDYNVQQPQYVHQPVNIPVNFCELIMSQTYESDDDKMITADSFGLFTMSQVPEEALHCYLGYVFTRSPEVMRPYFGRYSEVLREVPISTTGQQRVDLALIYKSPSGREPLVYSLIEVKKVEVTLTMLRQLLGYLKLFSEQRKLDMNALEGVFVAPAFEDSAVAYARDRARIETERPIRLLRIGLQDGTMAFTTVL